MAVNFQNSSQGQVSASTSLSFAHTVSAGGALYLVVAFSVESGFSPSPPYTVTYNGIAMTLIASVTTTFASGSSQPTTIYMYGLVNPPVGSFNVSISSAGPAGSINGAAASFTGVNQTTPIFASGTALNPGGGGSTVSFTYGSSPVDGMIATGIASGIEPSGGLTFGVGHTLRQTVVTTNVQRTVLGTRPTVGGFINTSATCPFGGGGTGLATLMLNPSPISITSLGSSTAAIGLGATLLSMASSTATLTGMAVEPVTVIDPAGLGIKRYAQSMTWAPNQPKILTVVDERLVEDGTLLNVGDLVQYTDPDLGLIFYGRIFERQLQYKPGEGVVYLCADIMRELYKTPARADCAGYVELITPPIVHPTTRLGVHDLDLTVNDVLDFVIDPFSPGGLYPTVIPGGYINISAQNPVIIEFLDKGGMTIGNWLDDLLDQTEGLIAYVPPSLTPTIVIADYYNNGSIPLLPDNINIVTSHNTGVPTPSNPILVNADIRETSDGKYNRIVAEGGPNYERITESIFGPTAISVLWEPWICTDPPSCVNYRSRSRFYFGAGNIVTGLYFADTTETTLDDKVNCVDIAYVRFDYAYQNGYNNMTLAPFMLGCQNGVPEVDDPGAICPNGFIYGQVLQDLDDVNAYTGADPNPYKCQFYIEPEPQQFLHQGGIGTPIPNIPPPTPTVTRIHGRYTLYLGPVVIEYPAADIAGLVHEGKYVIQDESLFKFYSPGYTDTAILFPTEPEPAWNEDPTVDLQALAERYYKVHSRRVNTQGSITVHIKGITGTPVPGIELTGLPFTNLRARNLNYDFVQRNITFDVSDIPLRDRINNLKDEKVGREELKDNWRDRKPEINDEPCFPAFSIGWKNGCPCTRISETIKEDVVTS